MIEWLPTNVLALHGQRAVLCVRGHAWGAGGSSDHQINVATRIAGLPNIADHWRAAHTTYLDGDDRLVGWIPETSLLELEPKRMWPDLSDEMIARFWPDVISTEDKAALRDDWRALEAKSRS
jgi:hypothetical protein